MLLLDDDGCIIRSDAVVARIIGLVAADATIAAAATDVALDSQRWGSSALHFSARARDSGAAALLKVNVAAGQLWWTRALAQERPELLPEVYASGEDLGGEALGWVLWERVAGGLHSGWRGREFDILLDAGVQFQRASRTLASRALAAGAIAELRLADLAVPIERGVSRAAPGPAEHVLARLAADWTWVNDVCEREVCHGDLHMANALCRDGPPDGVALLIDHHPTRMPWAWEPAKPEILNADSARLGCRNLIARQAEVRARLGLSAPAGPDLARLQAIVLGWWAIQLWGSIGPSPDPQWRSPAVWRAENEAYIAAAARA